MISKNRKNTDKAELSFSRVAAPQQDIDPAILREYVRLTSDSQFADHDIGKREYMNSDEIKIIDEVEGKKDKSWNELKIIEEAEAERLRHMEAEIREARRKQEGSDPDSNSDDEQGGSDPDSNSEDEQEGSDPDSNSDDET